MGKVSASYVTLAEAIRYATENQNYYITDNLTVAHVSKDGQYIYAKDAAGQALNPFYPGMNFPIDKNFDDNAYAYDQSNWVEIQVPSAKRSYVAANRSDYMGKTIAGGTLYGTFKSRNNPQMVITDLPVFNDGDYTVNALSASVAYTAFYYNSFDSSSDNGVGVLCHQRLTILSSGLLHL